jgi:hypothetical protein
MNQNVKTKTKMTQGNFVNKLCNEKLTTKSIIKIFNEGKTIYWCQNVAYGELLVSTGNKGPISDTFLVASVNMIDIAKGITVCSFHTAGLGFFLESKDFGESLQVYKATEGRDYYFLVNEMTDKKRSDTKSKDTVISRKELQSFLTEYSKGMKSFFVSGYDNSIEKCFNEFIK